MASAIVGGCRCGAIRYEATAEPVLAVNCHCRDCQQVSGSAFLASVLVPTDSFTFTTGSPKYHDVQADSGNLISRGFCAECGSPVVAKLSATPQFTAVRVGSLDDSSWYRPAMEVYTESAQPWHSITPDIPHFPRMPPPSWMPGDHET